MRPFYRPARHPRSMNVAPNLPAVSHALAAPHGQPSYSLDEIVHERYTRSHQHLCNVISSLRFPEPSIKFRDQCSSFVKGLRIHKYLFVRTYEHVASCNRSQGLLELVNVAHQWAAWTSVEQLRAHSSIKAQLLKFSQDSSCNSHTFLRVQPLVIPEDDSDLLLHLLYCVKKQELYTGSNSSPVIELLWQFLKQPQENKVARRLRASVYRMARKSAYVPGDLQIHHPSISNRENLGSGAHGVVTKARVNNRDVVIKKIPYVDRATQKKCLELFAGEAILWSTLQHKNIVPFLGVVMEDTLGIGLVSPFFRNGDMSGYAKKCSPKERLRFASTWARDLAEGLEYIHSHVPPIVHGDLKGNNVLIDDTRHARLGDFGQSYSSDSGKYLDSTRVGLVAYNPVHWMAPELMSGGERAKATDKSDIYSLGCVLYEMVSGRIPFKDISFGEVVRRVQNGERPGGPELFGASSALWKAAESCWRGHPENRPSARRLVNLLS